MVIVGCLAACFRFRDCRCFGSRMTDDTREVGLSAGPVPLQDFPWLGRAVPWARHAFVLRVPGIATAVDRATVMERLAPAHAQVVRGLGFADGALWTAGQVHGAEVALVPDSAAAGSGKCVAGVDGLICRTPGVLLGIYVADCGPVFVADVRRKVIGLLHSGKKGTELNILGCCLKRMGETFGTQPEDVVLQLGPCIRPPAYEVAFAARILEQAREAGIPSAQLHDCGNCTAREVGRYYSYRVERGFTGRMLALFGLP